MLAKKALAGTAGAPKLYVEDVFSTYLYTGTGATQTITNGIDLSTEGGLVWIKQRSGTAMQHNLIDTARGPTNRLSSNSTDASSNDGGSPSFNSNGFTYAVTSSGYGNNGQTYASWTFRKAKKFFDVVTYTGNGYPNNKTISHNLGSVPGCIMVKRTDTTGNWIVWHRSLNGGEVYLNLTDASISQANAEPDWGGPYTAPTSTNFTVGSSTTNANGGTYVAYLFAHDAGGFGDAGSDSIIKCGSWTTPSDGSDGEVNLGFEPQWLLFKRTDSTENWYMFDNMRGITTGGNDPYLFANLSNAETGSVNFISLTPTGFKGNITWGGTYIYIAIRRGPMKTPTSGTSVFSPITTSAAAGTTQTTNFPVDFQWFKYRSGVDYFFDVDRLRGVSTSAGSTNTTPWLDTTSTAAENTANTNATAAWSNTGFNVPGISGGVSNIFYSFRRAPGFFDVVCYTGTGSAGQTYNHNLGVVPELIIVKRRSGISDWSVYSSTVGATGYLLLNTTDASVTGVTTRWNDTAPTSTVFSTGTSSAVNGSGSTYVAYLFASVSGVSKIGTYTGNGSSVTVTTDFQPRFILVKRTNSTGNWIVGDSARGLPAGNDPALFLNTTDAETTGQDWVDVSSTGFTVNETALNANVNTGTYLYLAVA